MTKTQIQSALAYLDSKKDEILPTAFERFAAKVKHSIKAGQVTGLTFPEPKVKKPFQGKYTSPERRAMIQATHDLREGGMRAIDAAKKACTCYHSYLRWMDVEKMPYTGQVKMGRQA